MTNFSPNDLIEKASMSVRSTNALRRTGIHTIADLLAYDRNNIPTIRNMGEKSVNEIYAFLDALATEDGGFRLLTADGACQFDETLAEPIFHSVDGLLYKDIPIESLGLSNRSYNRLKGAGYNFASQLLDLNLETLLAMNQLGINSANEIVARIETLSFTEAKTTANSENALCKTFALEWAKALHLHSGKLYHELLSVFEQCEECGIAVDEKDLFAVSYLRNAIKSKIIDFLSDISYGTEPSEITTLFPIEVRTIIVEIMEEMHSSDQIITNSNSKIERKRMTVLEYAQTITKENERLFFLKRLQGQTLEEIGSQAGVTRERVRQVTVKCLSRKPVLAEDKYIEIFQKYDLSREDFCLAFNKDEAIFYYLMMACDKRGFLSVEDMLTDETLPIEVRRNAEKIAYKKYVTIGHERIYKSRPALVDYVARTYFQDEGHMDDFAEYYEMLLEDVGLSDDPQLIFNTRTYENKFIDYDKILWKRGRRLRYYDISSYDFAELLYELAFDQYNDIEYSALKFFRDYPTTMQQYDIRDEYELHNLLKKLYRNKENSHINFGRMPMIEFGNADRDIQVLDMLIQFAPIAIQDLATVYEKEYGVLSGTFTANFLKNFDEYFHDGIYNISASPPLSSDQHKHMTSILTLDYYEISDVKRIYQREFSSAAVENINPYTLETLGFNVFASYVVKNTYPSAADYIRTLLTTDDLVDTRDFPSGLHGKVSYSTQLSTLKDTYEIIEYEPYRYINIRRLNRVGVTVQQLREYCEAVAMCIGIGEYFTIASLNNGGFSHPLDDLGFSEVFYASLLTEDKGQFFYQRMGRTKVFRKGRSISLIGFIEYIVMQENSIDIYEFTERLANQYGVVIDRFKIIDVVKNSPMHYDSIMEKVYIDYDTYFEEV